jgi:hypothetical protein
MFISEHAKKETGFSHSVWLYGAAVILRMSKHIKFREIH